MQVSRARWSGPIPRPGEERTLRHVFWALFLTCCRRYRRRDRGVRRRWRARLRGQESGASVVLDVTESAGARRARRARGGLRDCLVRERQLDGSGHNGETENSISGAGSVWLRVTPGAGTAQRRRRIPGRPARAPASRKISGENWRTISSRDRTQRPSGRLALMASWLMVRRWGESHGPRDPSARRASAELGAGPTGAGR